MELKDLKARLIGYSKDNNLSLEQVHEKIKKLDTHIDYEVLRAIYLNSLYLPTVNQIYILSKALNVSADYLLGLSDTSHVKVDNDNVTAGGRDANNLLAACKDFLGMCRESSFYCKLNERHLHLSQQYASLSTYYGKFRDSIESGDLTGNQPETVEPVKSEIIASDIPDDATCHECVHCDMEIRFTGGSPFEIYVCKIDDSHDIDDGPCGEWRGADSLLKVGDFVKHKDGHLCCISKVRTVYSALGTKAVSPTSIESKAFNNVEREDLEELKIESYIEMER